MRDDVLATGAGAAVVWWNSSVKSLSQLSAEVCAGACGVGLPGVVRVRVSSSTVPSAATTELSMASTRLLSPLMIIEF